MIKALNVLTLFVFLLLPVKDLYAQSSRLYYAGYMGLNVSSSQEFSETTKSIKGNLERSNGFSFASALGLRLDHKWRIEADLSYHNTDMDSITFSNGGVFDLAGGLKTYLLMINGFYDIDLEWQKVNPFISAGLGLAWHKGEIDDISGLGVDVKDDDFNIAWQMGGGLKYRMKENIALTGSYRYIGTTNIELGTYDLEYTNHEFRLGVEYDIPVH